MTHKEEVKLNRLQFKLEVELKIIQTMLNSMRKDNEGLVECLRRLIRDYVKMAG